MPVSTQHTFTAVRPPFHLICVLICLSFGARPQINASSYDGHLLQLPFQTPINCWSTLSCTPAFMSCFRFVSLVDFFYPSQSLSACLYVFSLCQSVCLSVSHLSLRACYSLSVCLCLPVFLCVSVSLSVSVCLSRSLSLSLSLLVHVLVTLSPSLSLISLFDYVLFTLSCLSLSVCLSLSPPPPPTRVDVLVTGLAVQGCVCH